MFRSRVILAFQISYMLALVVWRCHYAKGKQTLRTWTWSNCNFLKDIESYRTAKSSGRPKTNFPALSWRIIRVVSQDRGRSSRQIKALTDADCSQATLDKKAWRTKKRLHGLRLLPRHKVARLEFAPEHQTWDIIK